MDARIREGLAFELKSLVGVSKLEGHLITRKELVALVKSRNSPYEDSHLGNRQLERAIKQELVTAAKSMEDQNSKAAFALLALDRRYENKSSTEKRIIAIEHLSLIMSPETFRRPKRGPEIDLMRKLADALLKVRDGRWQEVLQIDKLSYIGSNRKNYRNELVTSMRVLAPLKTLYLTQAAYGQFTDDWELIPEEMFGCSISDARSHGVWGANHYVEFSVSFPSLRVGDIHSYGYAINVKGRVEPGAPTTQSMMQCTDSFARLSMGIIFEGPTPTKIWHASRHFSQYGFRHHEYVDIDEDGKCSAVVLSPEAGHYHGFKWEW